MTKLFATRCSYPFALGLGLVGVLWAHIGLSHTAPAGREGGPEVAEADVCNCITSNTCCQLSAGTSTHELSASIQTHARTACIHPACM